MHVASRNSRYQGIILCVRDSGSGSRVLTVLTREEGILDVFLFGGEKSKLAALASPYVEGEVFIYSDPSRSYRSLTDFSPVRTNPGIRESLYRLLGAAVVAETMLGTHGAGGEHEKAFTLVGDMLTALSESTDEETPYRVFAYLWQLLDLTGFAPDTNSCPECGKMLIPEENQSRQDGPRRGAFRMPGFEGLVCTDCVGKTGLSGQKLAVPAGTLKWIHALMHASSGERRHVHREELRLVPETLVRRLPRLDRESRAVLEQLTVELITQVSDRKIKSLGEFCALGEARS